MRTASLSGLGLRYTLRQAQYAVAVAELRSFRRAAELDGEPVLLLADGHCFREQALAFCSRAGADETGFRATSLSTLAQMAVGGAGVTLLPRLSVPIENRRGALVVRPFAPPVPARTLALVWRPRSPLAPALRPLAAALGESLRRVATRA